MASQVFFFFFLRKRNVRYLFKKSQIILFKYCVDVKNCESFRGFGYIYIYIDKRTNKQEHSKINVVH